MKPGDLVTVGQVDGILQSLNAGKCVVAFPDHVPIECAYGVTEVELKHALIAGCDVTVFNLNWTDIGTATVLELLPKQGRAKISTHNTPDYSVAWLASHLYIYGPCVGCSCEISLTSGCTCGYMEAEMQGRNMFRNPITKLWQHIE